MQQKFCVFCGKRIIEGARFCAFCGGEIVILDDEPESAAEVTEEPAPAAESAPEPVIEPAPETAPAAETTPKPGAEAFFNWRTPVAEPAPAPEPVPVPAPVVEPTPAPEPLIGNLNEPVPMPSSLKPAPAPEPIPIPIPEPVVEPAPEPEPVPVPAPVVEPTPAPVVEPTPIPVVEPAPIPVVEPTPIPVVEPVPAPVVEPVPAPVVEPVPEPEPMPELVHSETIPLPVGKVMFEEGDREVGINDPMFDMYNGRGEGTVVLVGPGTLPPGGIAIKKGTMQLTADEMKKGVTKILDFGTGKRFEVIFPEGLREGDTVVVKGTGIKDERSGADCEIKLSIKRF